MKITKTKSTLFLFCLFAFGLYAQETSETDTPVTIEETTEASDTENKDFSEEEIPTTSAEETPDNSDSYEENDNAESTSTLSNFFTNLFLSENKGFAEIEDLSFQIPTTTKIKAQNGNTVFKIDDDLAGIGTNYTSTAYYNILFDYKTRQLLISAGNKYLSDFNNKKLNRKAKNSMKIYGRTTANVYFGTMKGKASNTCKPTTYFGYKFKDSSPYFTINCLNALNERYKPDSTYPQESATVTLYFTKAQLTKLIESLSEDNLSKYRNVYINTESANDSY